METSCNFSIYDDDSLLKKMKTLVKAEREITLEVLHHLREVERRRLYAKIGYPNLFIYCLRELGYSESSAQRRIASMRLLKEMPEVEKKIIEGSLSLSVISQAQSFFRKEAQTMKPLTFVEKHEVLESLENKSAREAEHKLMLLSSKQEMPIAERIRPTSETHSELKLILSEDTLDLLEKIKGLLAHSRPFMNYSELVEYMAKVTLEKIDPARKSDRQKKLLPTQKPTEIVQDRFIPAALKRSVWRRDSGRCTYKDSKTGRKCGSQYKLQMDHIQPLALGGQSTIENLRLLCANHNQLEADNLFGREWMEKMRNPKIGSLAK